MYSKYQYLWMGVHTLSQEKKSIKKGLLEYIKLIILFPLMMYSTNNYSNNILQLYTNLLLYFDKL